MPSPLPKSTSEDHTPVLKIPKDWGITISKENVWETPIRHLARWSLALSLSPLLILLLFRIGYFLFQDWNYTDLPLWILLGSVVLMIGIPILAFFGFIVGLLALATEPERKGANLYLSVISTTISGALLGILLSLVRF